MLNILMGAGALGLLWAVVTIGVWLSYRVLDVADLSVEGSVVLGASVAAAIIAGGGSPMLATTAATGAGAAAGLCTGLLHTKLKIPALLSGILVMIALYSVNIRVMGGTSNISLLRKGTVFTPLTELALGKNPAAILLGGACCVLVIAAVCWFLRTEIGFAVRATGAGPQMAAAQGVNTDTAKILGLSLSNALVGLAGGLIAQYQGFADVQMGQGAIVIGLASLIIGEVLFGKKGIAHSLVAVTLGAIVYRIIIAIVIEAGMPATDLKLFTAVTVALALYLPTARKQVAAQIHTRKENTAHAANQPREQDLPQRNGKRTKSA